MTSFGPGQIIAWRTELGTLVLDTHDPDIQSWHFEFKDQRLISLSQLSLQDTIALRILNKDIVNLKINKGSRSMH